MKKKKLTIILINNEIREEYNLLASYDENKKIITYNESKDLLTEVTLDLKEKKLIRNNKDYLIECNFIENKEIIELKELNNKIILDIKTDIFKIDNSQIEIKYEILDSNEVIDYLIKM